MTSHGQVSAHWSPEGALKKQAPQRQGGPPATPSWTVHARRQRPQVWAGPAGLGGGREATGFWGISTSTSKENLLSKQSTSRNPKKRSRRPETQDERLVHVAALCPEATETLSTTAHG